MEHFITVVVLTAEKEIPDHIYWGLANQTYRRFEVIIANEAGIVNAMNKALERAKGDIFVRIDDDVKLTRNWLKSLVYSFDWDEKVAGVTGPTFIPKKYRQNRDSIRYAENPNWFLNWMFDNEPYALAKIYKCGSVSYGSNFEEHIPQGLYQIPCDHLEGTNWAMRTSLIRKIGGFDPKFDGVAEWYDTDAEAKIKKLGYYFMYNCEAIVIHELSKGKNFEKRYNGWGRIKNWCRYHIRHSSFHPKQILWLSLMGGYTIWVKFRLLYQQLKNGKTS